MVVTELGVTNQLFTQGGHCESETKHDGPDFKTLLSAMQILGFTAEEQDTIFRILASVLHLGNVFFHRKALKHGQEGVEMGSDAEVRWVSHLLQLRTDGIVSALTTKTTEARNEKLHTPLNIDQALDARDAVAKALYSSLFSWLVNRVNSIVNKGERALSINILDIFGFEDFPVSFFLFFKKYFFPHIKWTGTDFYWSYRKTAWSSCASTTPMKTYSSTLISTFLNWSNKNTPRSVSNGRPSLLSYVLYKYFSN